MPVINKTIVFVNGNICAGKSTCLEALKKKKDITVFSIDDLRKDMGVENFEEDNKLWARIYGAIINSEKKTIFLESSGTSKNENALFSLFQNRKMKCIRILIKTDMHVCFERFQKRDKKGIFIENKFDIDASIKWIYGELAKKYFDFEINGNESMEECAMKFLKIFGV